MKRQEDYQAERETAYANMADLMPFADTALWVEYGNGLSGSDDLAAKRSNMYSRLTEREHTSRGSTGKTRAKRLKYV